MGDNVVMDGSGNPEPPVLQKAWELAGKDGLRPSTIRFFAGHPFAVWADGSGIYGPLPQGYVDKANAILYAEVEDGR